MRFNIIFLIPIGLFSGLIFHKKFKIAELGLIPNIFIGIIGAFLGDILHGYLAINLYDYLVTVIISELVAAFIFLYTTNFIKSKYLKSKLGEQYSVNSHKKHLTSKKAISQNIDQKSFSRKQKIIEKGKIFISYRRDDSADVTGRIYDRLTQHYGRKLIFKDVDSIPLGVDFRKHIDEMVGNCSIFITVIGDQWLTRKDFDGKRRLDNPRDHVRIEIESALKRRIPVIPVLVRGVNIPSEEDLPSSLKELAYRNGIQVRPDPDFHKDVDRLIAGLEACF